MKVAFISGTSIARSNLFDGWQEETITTPHGMVVVRTRGDLVVLNRHGFGAPRPPHAINHRANIAALRAWGVEEAVSLNSVGSLKSDLPPGSLVSVMSRKCTTRSSTAEYSLTASEWPPSFSTPFQMARAMAMQ